MDHGTRPNFFFFFNLTGTTLSDIFFSIIGLNTYMERSMLLIERLSAYATSGKWHIQFLHWNSGFSWLSWSYIPLLAANQ
jgi:hypothetical protein